MGKRDIGVFVRDIIRKPPALFPYIAGFHLLLVLFVIIFWWGAPFTFYYIELFWSVGFTFFWVYVCLLKRWAAYGYLGLTVANIILYSISLSKEGFAQEAFQRTYVSSLWLPALLFSFFILFFFRRINGSNIDVPKL
ncbi:MAG TPA: hypothetical protein VEB40_07925 [Flavipsychrobacter sp.]|nr:hypothetical protein [Flavipsychrobacter sp.]